MEKRIDVDAMRVLSSGASREDFGDGQERRRDGTEKRIAGLMRLSKEGDRNATLELARAMLGDDYPGTGRG
jgi:hypothetical protein